MNTPIYDFVKTYANKNKSRFHMPGHKGSSLLGPECLDITEIDGADVLSEAKGIIGESEKNATSIFGSAHTFYTTQGSTTAICAMLALVESEKPRPLIWAARNVHKAFVHAVALLDFDVEFIMPEDFASIIKCEISPPQLYKKLENANKMPDAIYITSPDYLGNMQDIKGIAEVCKSFNIPLLVDNAHGAYLKFLPESLHPLDEGATVCCDSAHKTLPVLTGGAYLHIAKNAPQSYVDNARQKLALFSSTSPSYLTLQSLDLCNAYLSDNFKTELLDCIKKITLIKKELTEKGFVLSGDEPLKIVIHASKSGYTGKELAAALKEHEIEIEFCDNDFLALMCTPQNSKADFERLQKAFSGISAKAPLEQRTLSMSEPERICSVRKAVFAKQESVAIKKAKGRICASLTVSCPPAVPIAICGERITTEHIELFEHYGIETVEVTK
ncbi:MAG: amino acid decarboxylase [Clostridia bacterium]|nr:amino acid decarboxylase [Clostridia bacterium]